MKSSERSSVPSGLDLPALDLSRRDLLRGGVALATAAALPRIAFAKDPLLSEALRKELASTPYVYVSPLHPDGKESKCHGEVWYFLDGDDVVLATSKDAWKARALRKGWDRARIWVGDLGRISQAKDKLPDALQFDAKAEWESDRAAFDRLLTAFGEKYPGEWGKWKPRFESGYKDGSRLVIRYKPLT